MTLGRRVKDLEARQPATIGFGHRVIVKLGQTEAEALAAYGTDLIGPDDLIVFRRIVCVDPRAMTSAAVH